MPDGYLTHSSPLRRADASTIDDARAVKRLDGSVDVLGVAPRDASRRMDVLGRHVAKMYGVTAVRSEATREPCLERAS